MRGDDGAVMVLAVGVALVAGLVVAATVAASAAFLAQRDLAGFCDGAATAAVAGATTADADGLPAIDPGELARELAAYPDAENTEKRATTDGTTAEVRCTRTVEIPFGAVVGAPDGLVRTVVARARPVARVAGTPVG